MAKEASTPRVRTATVERTEEPSKQTTLNAHSVPERYRLPDNPVPLEEDSDPDFNPGAYTPDPELTKKGREKKKATGARRVKGRKTRLQIETESDDEDYQPKGEHFKRRVLSRSSQGNPLKEFFGGLFCTEWTFQCLIALSFPPVGELGLQSASEDGGEDSGADDEAEEEHPSSEVEQEDDQPVVLRTLAVLTEARSRTKSQSREVSQSTGAQAGDDSVTEPESDEEEVPITVHAATSAPSSQGRKRKSPAASESAPPAKKAKYEAPDDSVTEPESEPEPEQESETESETEPESDVESEQTEDVTTRPLLCP
ncbi:hypothetical protein NM688_g7447 [Phlebia brevispora]|uniref:Uncharacterized protein n=1 Tax=Phlebia brevispora TaxID=194682 RepID=A0ACC1S544_9APHY|nr:hypothetical protein NM688_g7447 [Phlebia brevispora]